MWSDIKKASNEALVNGLSMMSPCGPKEKQALLEAKDLKSRAEMLVAITTIELGARAGRRDRRFTELRRTPPGRGRFIEADRALDDIERPALRLGVDAPDIKPDDAGHQHVGAPERGDDHDRRAPASLEARIADAHRPITLRP